MPRLLKLIETPGCRKAIVCASASSATYCMPTRCWAAVDLLVAGNATFAAGKAPRFGEGAARDIERAVGFVGGAARACSSRPNSRDSTCTGSVGGAAIDADDFAVVAIDGQLRFERFDEIERFEHVLHRIVVAIRGELHFELAGHRAATDADDEANCARRLGLAESSVTTDPRARKARGRPLRLGENFDVCGGRITCRSTLYAGRRGGTHPALLSPQMPGRPYTAAIDSRLLAG